jgi:hypothetical protein
MRHLTTGLAVAIVAFTTGAAQASLTTIKVNPGDYVKMSFGSQYYVMNGETGGEFGMTVYDGNMNLKGTFYTFCADPTVLMNIGVLYRVNELANSNELGYTISDYGKWIYYEYAKNDSLPLVSSYIPGHQSSDFTSLVAGAIQEGIWGQLTKNGSVDWPTGWGSIDDPSNAYNQVSTAGNWFSHFTNNDDSSFATYKNAIKVAQLKLGNDNVQNQMVLTFINGSGPPVPEPATMVVWLLLGAASWLGMKICRRGRLGV